MLRSLLLLLLRLYRLTLSPLLGNVCRFEPSCSRYASACIERFGAARGSWLTVKRLCKCHPFHPGGYDPPPPGPRPEDPSVDAGGTLEAEARALPPGGREPHSRCPSDIAGDATVPAGRM